MGKAQMETGKNKTLLAQRIAGSTWRLLFICFASLALLIAAPRAHYRHHGTVLLNDVDQTPGKVRTTDAKEVCSETTKQFRNTTQAMKNQVYAAYGVQRNKGICAGGCEVDHLVSLELGGADDVDNLWPQPSQPKPGFHEKDWLENFAHKEVCAGRMKLEDAQTKIVQDWYAFYLEIHKLPAGHSGGK